MKKIGIIICGRYQTCSGGKCFRSLRERVGGFARYPKAESVEVVGYSYCGGCPGGNVEYVPEEMIKNGAEVIHLATGLVVGYPPCPYIREFKEFIEKRYGLPVVVGTHPIPLKYLEVHKKLPFWKNTNMEELAGDLMKEDKAVMESYN
jgi:predicted metal-binding protein